MKPKILFFTKHPEVDRGASGVGRYVEWLTDLLKDDVEYTFPSAKNYLSVVSIPQEMMTKSDAAIASPTKVRSSRKPAAIRLMVGYLCETLRVARVMKKYRKECDIIHLNRIGCEVETIAARLAGFKKIVGTVHNLPGHGDVAEYWVRKWLERSSFLMLSSAIYVCDTAHDEWAERLPISRKSSVRIYNGIDPDSGKWDVKSGTWGVGGGEKRTEGEIRIGICARLHYMKGHLVLLEAVADLIAKNLEPRVKGGEQRGERVSGGLLTEPTGVRLLIAGEGPARKTIEAKIDELGLGDVVEMLGHISDPMQFYANIDINVLPSIALECMPFSVVEAMFMAVPSVVSDVGGAKEVIVASGGGEVVPAGDVDALADALQRFCIDEDFRKKAGSSACEYAQNHLTANEMAQQTLRVYVEAEN